MSYDPEVPKRPPNRVKANRIAPAGSSTSIDVARLEAGLESVRVIDRGPGVDPGPRERVFKRFVRGDSEDH